MDFSLFGHCFTRKSGIVNLMEDFGDANRSDRPVYMLGGGNPARIPAIQEIFRKQMTDLLNDGDAFDRMAGCYDVPQGESGFLKSLADLLRKEYGWPVSERNIALTNGSQSSFYALFNAFAGEFPDGSFKQVLLPLAPEYIGYTEIACQRPLFRSYRPAIEQDAGDGFFKYRVDFDSFTGLSGIGAICVSRPTNPTGNVITDNELRKLSELAKAGNVPLIIDGAYGIPFPGIVFTDASVSWDRHIILCLSLSKLGLPGLRTGIVIASEPVIEMISHINAVFSLAIGSTGPMLVKSLVRSGEILALGRDIVKPYYRDKMQQAVKWVNQYMANIPVRIHKPEGALFLWLWFEDLPVSSRQLYQRLKSRGVYVVAGEHFFPGLDEDDWHHKHECIRVSYAGDAETVETGIRLMASELNSLYSRTAA